MIKIDTKIENRLSTLFQDREDRWATDVNLGRMLLRNGAPAPSGALEWAMQAARFAERGYRPEAAFTDTGHRCVADELLRERFAGLFEAVVVDTENENRGRWVYDNVLAPHYRESHRAYHTLEHIESCLRVFDEHVLADVSFFYWRAIELSIWFHDVIYDPTRPPGVNELESAETFEHHVGSRARRHLADTVTTMIMDSARHGRIGPKDATHRSLFLDIDLSILGAPRHVFAKYERDIRTEYAFAPEAAFRERRVLILGDFLARSTIYRAERFQELFEGRARSNLLWSIARLSS